MEMTIGVSLLRSAQSLLTGRTIPGVSKYFKCRNFRETPHVGSFVKIKLSQNGKITLLVTDIGVSCPCREFLMSQIRLLTLFTKTESIAGSS